MRNLKKLLALVVVIAMALTLAMPVFAADAPKYSAEAQKLNAMGLYDGISTGSFNPDLGSTLDRQTGATLLVKLLGKKADALALSDADVTAALAPFKDADKIATWAKNYVAYAIKSGMSNGMAADAFGPAELMNANQLATLIVRYLGGTVTDVNTGLTSLQAKGGLTADQATAFAALTSFTKDSVVGIAFGALSATDAAGKKLIENLVAAKVVTEAKAIEAGLIAASKALDIDTVSAISNAKIKVALNTAATAADVAATTVAVADKDSKAVAVKSTVASPDLKTVYVTTDAMVPGAVYTATIGGTAYKFVANVANTNSLKPTVAASKNNIEVEVTFSANVDPVTALNPANYAIDNNMKVSAVTAGADATKVVLATSAQTAGTLYKITVTNVLDELGNSLDTTANTVYFGGKAADTTAPVPVASSDTNTRFKITYQDSSDMDAASVLNLTNYKVDGGLTIVSAAYDKDADGNDIKNVVLFTTSKQTAGALYTLTLNNIADKFGNKITADTKIYFGGRAADTTAPTVKTSMSASNTSLKVTFDDSSKMDETSVLVVANYVVSGLTLSDPTYDATTKTVTFKTTAQTAGTLYKAVINNIKDEYGNTITANTESYFGGKAVDNTAPTVDTAASKDNTTVELTFSDVLDSKTVQPYYFSIDNGLGFATSATLDTTGKKVTLTTLPQVSSKVYTITIGTEIKNTDGTAVAASTTKSFAGKGTTSSAAPKVLTAMALDNATFVVTFDSDLAVVPTITIQKGDGSVWKNSTNVNVTVSGVAFYNDTKNQVVASINNDVFADGGLYKAVITAGTGVGANGVAVGTTDNTALFAGSGTTPAGAKVLAAVAVDNTTVNLVFDKAVTLKTAAPAFDVSSIKLMKSDKTTAVTYDGNAAHPVVGQLQSLSTDGKTLTVYFRNGTYPDFKLDEGTIYTVKVSDLTTILVGSLTLTADATTGTGSDYATAQFGALGTTSAKPQIVAAVAQSKYVVDLVFDRGVKINEDVTTIESTLVIQPLTTGKVMPKVALAKVLDDNKKVRLFLNEKAGGVDTDLVDGQVYAIRYTPVANNFFSDAVDAGVKADIGTGTYKDVSFAALPTAAKGPAITAITAVNANTFNVTLDQIGGNLAAGTAVVVKEGTAPVSGIVIVPASDKLSFKIVKTDGIFKLGTTYSISLPAALTDESGLRASDDTVVTTVGGIGNTDLVLTAAVVGAAPAGTITATLVNGATPAVAVNDKELRFRALSATGAVTFDGTAAVYTESPAAGTNTVAVVLGVSTVGDQYIIEATDGSVAITFVR